MKARIRELEVEVQRLREANRRLQQTGPALERDKLIKALREQLIRLHSQQELTHLPT